MTVIYGPLCRVEVASGHLRVSSSRRSSGFSRMSASFEVGAASLAAQSERAHESDRSAQSVTVMDSILAWPAAFMKSTRSWVTMPVQLG